MRTAANDRTRLGLLLIVLCWIVGSGALSAGLRRDTTDYVATGIFVAVGIAWWTAYRLLLDGGRIVRILSLVVLGFWTFALVMSAIIGKAHVYMTGFFLVSICLVLILLSASIARGSSGAQHHS